MLNIMSFFDCSPAFCFHRFFCHVRKLLSLFAVFLFLFLFLFLSLFLFLFFLFCGYWGLRVLDGKIHLGICYQLGLQDYVCVMVAGTVDLVARTLSCLES